MVFIAIFLESRLCQEMRFFLQIAIYVPYLLGFFIRFGSFSGEKGFFLF